MSTSVITTDERKRVSPERNQYFEAIGMSSANLGAILKEPTERIAEHVGNVIFHEEEAKRERAGAQQEFNENIAYYYEAKQRLLNPGYRTDVDGGKDRSPSDNEKWFGAPNWEAFNAQCRAYSLQHSDRKLKAFAKAQGVLTDDGDNIDDPEQEEDDPKLPEPRRTPDHTAQKRYEHIATAAMAIANKNPEGEIEKQILAEAEHVPAPLMLLPPDIFTDVLSFITKIASSIADGNVRAEAKRLLGKMLLHKPTPDPARVLADATEEEKRKRAKRLAKKNGEALGSATYNPPANGASEHVQRSEPMPSVTGCDVGGATLNEQKPDPAPETTDNTRPVQAEGDVFGAALRLFLATQISALNPGVKLQWVNEKTPAGRDWWTLKSSKPSIAAPMHPSPVVTTPTATAILEPEWSERFHQTAKGRWRKRTKNGIEGSMSWVQEMLVRSVAQKNPNLLPTPEACEEMMGFPAGWTDPERAVPLVPVNNRVVPLPRLPADGCKITDQELGEDAPQKSKSDRMASAGEIAKQFVGSDFTE